MAKTVRNIFLYLDLVVGLACMLTQVVSAAPVGESVYENLSPRAEGGTPDQGVSVSANSKNRIGSTDAGRINSENIAIPVALFILMQAIGWIITFEDLWEIHCYLRRGQEYVKHGCIFKITTMLLTLGGSAIAYGISHYIRVRKSHPGSQ